MLILLSEYRNKINAHIGWGTRQDVFSCGLFSRPPSRTVLAEYNL